MTEWANPRLDEVAFIQQGKRVDHQPIGFEAHPMYGANSVIGSWTEGTYSFDVVGMGCRGSVGMVTTIPAGSWLGNNVMGIWPRDDSVLNLDFLRLALEIADLRSTGVISGQVQEQITRQSLSPLTIRVPPMPEQRRIVDLICALDAPLAAMDDERLALARLPRALALSWLGSKQLPLLRLGNVAHMYQPQTLAKAVLTGGPYPVFGANGQIGFHDEFNHAASQIAVTCRGATCGKVNWTPPECWITGNAMVVQPDQERATGRYLFWALQLLADLTATISGSAQPQITRTTLSPLRLPIPSLDEQDDLAQTLDAISAYSEALTPMLQ